MPEFDTVLESVRTELAVVDRRLAEIERQRDEVLSHHARLTAALSVLEEHADPHADAALSSEVPDPPPLSARVLDALGSSARTRAHLIRLFRPLGIPEATLDSTLSRLRKRGLIQRRGRQIIPLVPTPSSASSPSRVVASGGPDVDPRSADSEPAALGTATVVRLVEHSPGPIPVPRPAPTDEAGEAGEATSIRARVRDAVATSAASTRAALVKHLGAQGIRAGAVDNALSGLKRRGVLKRRADGVHVVVPGADVATPSAAASEGS